MSHAPLLLQIWSGSSDGSVAATDLDGSMKLDTNLARSLKTPSGKGTKQTCHLSPLPPLSLSWLLASIYVDNYGSEDHPTNVCLCKFR